MAATTSRSCMRITVVCRRIKVSRNDITDIGKNATTRSRPAYDVGEEVGVGVGVGDGDGDGKCMCVGVGLGEADADRDADADGEGDADGVGVARWAGDALVGGAAVGSWPATVGPPPGVGTGDGESPGKSPLLAVTGVLAAGVGAPLVRAASVPAECECPKVIAVATTAAITHITTPTTALAIAGCARILLHVRNP